MQDAGAKLLVIRLSSLGDIVLLVPALLALRRALPGAFIHLLTKDRYAGLFEKNTFLDRLVPVHGGGPRELAKLRATLARERYDAIIDAHNVIRSNVLYHALRAPMKLQIAKSEFKKFVLIAGKLNLFGRVVTQSERYAKLLAALGVEWGAESHELPVPPEAEASAARHLAGIAGTDAPLVAFAPGARWSTKMWPERHFVDLASEVSRAGCRIALIGGPDDVPLSRSISREVSPAPVDLTGKLSILESAAVLRRSAALVTNDSAPLHLAESVGTPVVAFFGPTVREFGYFPRLRESSALEVKLRCRPCSRNGARSCPYGTKECLAAIAPSRAFEALAGILEARQVRT